MQELVAQTYVAQEIVSYIVELIHETRRDPFLERGASPRATLAVVAMAKSIARLRGRDFVIPKDVQEVFVQTVAHRLERSAKAGEQEVEDILRAILQSVPAPKLR